MGKKGSNSGILYWLSSSYICTFLDFYTYSLLKGKLEKIESLKKFRHIWNLFCPLCAIEPQKNHQQQHCVPTFFSADCLTWNATIAIWNASLPDQIGTLIDRFCPEISAKEYILNITTRKIVIRWAHLICIYNMVIIYLLDIEDVT